MRYNKNTAPSADNSALTYSELSFTAAFQNSTICTRAEPETTYAQIAVKLQSAQQNPGSEATPGKDQRQQETAGGTDSKKSRSLGLVALLIIISLFAITIGLTVYVLQFTHICRKEQRILREHGDWLNVSLANSLRNLTEMSERLLQSRQKEISLCATLRKMSESLCSRAWEFHNGSCYRFATGRRNWNRAKKKCETLNSQLLIINTQQEENFTIEFVNKSTEPHWIGLWQGSESNPWIWVDQTVMSSPGWQKNQPDNSGGNEDCATIARDDRDNTFGWNDDNCETAHFFICEKPAPSWIGAAAFEKYCP